MMRLTGLFVYPLKSGRAVPHDTAELDWRGLVGDRRWMTVDDDGVLVSIREVPAFVTVEARVVAGGLALAAAGHGAIEVATPAAGAPRRRVTVWSQSMDAALVDPAASRWLAAVLGRDVALVHLPDDVVRPVPKHYGRPGDRVSFADGFPLLLTTEASLADLNARMAAPLPMDRFRPNLVIDGAAPWAEDGWKRIRIGGLTMRVAKECVRCVATTTDMQTGARGVEPLRTLATFRRGKDGVEFGQNLIPDEVGALRIGDPVEVIE